MAGFSSWRQRISLDRVEVSPSARLGDSGSSTRPSPCHHSESKGGFRRNSNSITTTTTTLLLALLRAPLGQPPSGCIPRRFLPDWLRRQARRALPLTSPLPIGCMASSGIKGAASPTSSPVRCSPSAVLRMRPPGVPLTPLPAINRSHGHDHGARPAPASG